MAKGFDIRREDYNYIHSNTKEDWNAFMKALNPKKGEKILDGAGGYGDVSKHILDISKPQIWVLDTSKEQLELLKNKKILPDKNLIVGDIRKIPFPTSFFDSCIIKMGLHETSKKDHVKILKEVYRVLKPNGKFVTWELALTKDNQRIFQKFIRKKDKLSGFKKMAKSRYFPRHDENMKNIISAGFKKVKDVYTKYYIPMPSLRFKELVSEERAKLLKKKGKISKENQVKLDRLSKIRVKKLSDFGRKLIKPSKKKLLKFKEFNNGDFGFEVKKRIYAGYKY